MKLITILIVLIALSGMAFADLGEAVQDDDGQNIYTKGTLYTDKGNFEDYCIDEFNVMENWFYKENNVIYIEHTEYFCQFGCEDGACLETPKGDHACNDPDGEDISTFGQITWLDENEWNHAADDICLSDNKVAERICEDEFTPSVKYIFCPEDHSCLDGACIPLEEPTEEVFEKSCAIWYGNNVPNIPNQVGNTPWGLVDGCSADEYCSLRLESGTFIECENGCEDSACIPKPKPMPIAEPPVPITEQACKDTDNGKNFYMKGYITGTHEDGGDFVNKGDSCLNANSLLGEETYESQYLGELYCENNVIKAEVYECNCVDGTCVEGYEGDFEGLLNKIEEYQDIINKEMETAEDKYKDCSDTLEEKETTQDVKEYYEKYLKQIDDKGYEIAEIFGLYEDELETVEDFEKLDKLTGKYRALGAEAMNFHDTVDAVCENIYNIGVLIDTTEEYEDEMYFKPYIAFIYSDHDVYEPGETVLVTFSLNKDTDAKLKLIDSLGQELPNVVSMSQDEYTHKAKFIAPEKKVLVKVVSEGYTLYKGQLFSISSDAEEILEEIDYKPYSESCKGCEYEGKCIDVGLRFADGRMPSYCDIDYNINMQKEDKTVCQNNFECLSNSCSNGKCVDFGKELEEQKNILKGLIEWLKNFFGFFG